MVKSPRVAVWSGCLVMLGWASWTSADQQPARVVPQVVAHRGSSVDRPENTLASARRAIEAGAAVVEVDVRTTRDGALVLSHDATLERTTDGHGRINDWTLADIQRLDAGRNFSPKFSGERVPTLDQVLTLCRGKADVLLHLKEGGPQYDRRVAAAVRVSGEPKHIIVGVHSVEQARQFRELLPEARQMGMIEEPGEIEAYAAAGVEIIRLWPKWLADSSLVGRVRRAGMKLHLNGTTGDRSETAELLKYGPDSLLTDDPARLIASLEELAGS